MVLVGGACFLAAILLMTQMEFVMMASNYDGSITVDVAFRSGTKVEVMNQRIQTLEDALLSDENFESVTLDLSGNTASFTAYSVDNCDRSSEAAVEEYTARFGSVPDMDVSVSPSGAMDMSALMSSNSKDVVLLGSDLDTLQTAAEQVDGGHDTGPPALSASRTPSAPASPRAASSSIPRRPWPWAPLSQRWPCRSLFAGGHECHIGGLRRHGV